jgi:hypothetical protein
MLADCDVDRCKGHRRANGRRAVPVAFVVRRELRDHNVRSGRDGDDLVVGRTTAEAFYPSTTAARARKAWLAAGVEPLTLHEARHCAIGYSIAAGPDWKQISTGPGTVTCAKPGTATGISCRAASRRPRLVSHATWRARLSRKLSRSLPEEANGPAITGPFEYRYRDSKPPDEPG